jgi:ABC-2 type transport system permease protein
MLNLVRRLTARYSIFLTVNLVLLAGFEFLLCLIVSTLNLPALLADVVNKVPPLLRAFMEQQFVGGLGAAGLLAYGWTHPIALAVGAAAAIVLAARAVAGEVEAGTLELVLSQPLSRARYFAGQVLFALSALAALSLGGAAGTFIGQKAFHLEALSGGTLFRLALNYFLLQAAWYGLVLLLSVFGREAGRVAFAGFILALTSYLLQVVAQVWSRAAFLLPYSLNAYYSPQEIFLRHVIPAKSVLVLLGLTVLGLGLALAKFERRDIP